MWHPDMPDEFKNQIVTGDARELARQIPDESVGLIFTDPVYDRIDDYRWLAETAARMLKPGGDVLVYLAQFYLDKVLAAMALHLEYRWLCVTKKVSSGMMIWKYNLVTNYLPILWFSKGPTRVIKSRLDFGWGRPNGGAVNHDWSKNTQEQVEWLTRFSLADDIILDPFCGGGSMLAACKILSRNFIAFEIDPATAERARERVQNTQPPLFVLEPEQAALWPALDTAGE